MNLLCVPPYVVEWFIALWYFWQRQWLKKFRRWFRQCLPGSPNRMLTLEEFRNESFKNNLFFYKRLTNFFAAFATFSCVDPTVECLL